MERKLMNLAVTDITSQWDLHVLHAPFFMFVFAAFLALQETEKHKYIRKPCHGLLLSDNIGLICKIAYDVHIPSHLLLKSPDAFCGVSVLW